MVRFYVILALALTAPQAVHAADYHHVHLTADPAEAGARWYVEHMDCEDFGRANACRIGSVELIFFDRDPAGGSVGTGADHIGISFADLTAKMAELETAGVTVLEPIRQGRWPLAFIEDPWGTKVEVVQDPDVVGFHHVHLLSADPEATMTWYEELFGGERQPDAWRRLRFGQVSLRFRQAEGPLEKTQGRAIDHLGFRVPDLEAAAAAMRAKGISFQVEPRPFTDPLGQEKMISLFEGPDGVRIEVLEVVD